MVNAPPSANAAGTIGGIVERRPVNPELNLSPVSSMLFNPFNAMPRLVVASADASAGFTRSLSFEDHLDFSNTVFAVSSDMPAVLKTVLISFGFCNSFAI